jgi:hypothetical protein
MSATNIRRSHVKRLALLVTLASLTFLIAIPAYASVWGAYTDLNNIPITDTLEEGTMEWDVTGRFNEDFARGRKVDSRLFGALFEDFEFGMSWGISRRPTAGPMSLSLKYKVLDEYGGQFPVSLAVGAKGITGNYNTTGMDPTFFGVIGIHDVYLGGWWDWYVGLANNPTGYDDEDNSVFGGFKYWIDEDIQFNADYWGYSDNGDFIVTGGLNYDWMNHIGFQGWVEHDSVTEDEVFILQLVTRADMRDLTAEVSDPE